MPIDMRDSVTRDIEREAIKKMQAVNSRMQAMPPKWRYRWCDCGPCGCMGCANRSGGMTSKEDWDRWVERNPRPENGQ